jgi:hypothetical protein
MRRDLVDKLLRELARVSGKAEVVIIGSQSLHADAGKLPAEVLVSVEVDLLMEDGDPAEPQIEAELGRSSAFQAEHGVYIDVVRSSFPYLPDGWEGRLRDMQVGELRARCLEVHDLAVSKLAAGRLKDNEFIAALIGHRLLDVDTLRARIGAIADLRLRAILLARLQIVLESVA